MTTHNDQDKKQFDAALYWADKPIKKFVVTLTSRETDKTETRIFAASCSDRASELALQNTDLVGSAQVREIRLATPEDLGAEPAPSKQVNALAFDPERLKAVLADCLLMMQSCEQHRLNPSNCADPVGTEAWDVTVAIAVLTIKQEAV